MSKQTKIQAAKVPCFVKQLGALAVCDNANLFDFPDDARLTAIPGAEGFASCCLQTKHLKGGEIAEWPSEIRVRKFYNDQAMPCRTNNATNSLKTPPGIGISEWLGHVEYEN